MTITAAQDFGLLIKITRKKSKLTQADLAAASGLGVRFVREPKKEPYGTVAVFEDLYGNRFDLIEFAR
jgi:hypothetical protein